MVEIKLTKKPKNPTIIEGFPGLGFIGSIATEFLVEHLKAEKIGKIEFNEQTPVVAIHNSKVVEPFGIFYSKKYNLIILHAINPVNNIEWKITDAIEQLDKHPAIEGGDCNGSYCINNIEGYSPKLMHIH